MKSHSLIPRILLSTLFFFIITSLQAGKPLWTFVPLTPTTVSVPINGATTIKYTVTNQSRKTHTLVMTPIAGITQDISSSNCLAPFVLGYQKSCTLVLKINGAAINSNIAGGPVVCEQANLLQCYQPAQVNSLNITKEQASDALISASPANLVLITNQSGKSITITNQSTTVTAQNIKAVLPASWTDVIQNADACASLAPGSSCQIFFTAGNNTHALATIPIKGDNTSTTYINIEIQFPPSISASPTNLLLITNQSGKSVTITNQSTTFAAQNIKATLPASWTDVSQDAGACTSLAPGDSCQIIFTAGYNAHALATIPIKGENTSTVYINIEIQFPPVAIAAGTYNDSSNVQRPLLALSQDSGATWIYPSSIAASVFVPDNTSHPFNNTGLFNGASCSGSTCVAAGFYSDSNNIQRPLLALSQYAGTIWTYPSAINAPVFVPDNTSNPFINGSFRDASCSNATCIAAGVYLDNNSIQRPLLAQSQDSGTTWAYPSSINAVTFVPDNISHPFNNTGSFQSTNCNGSICIAAGTYNDSSNVQRPLLAQSQDSGTTWTYPSAINAPAFVPDNISHPFNDSGFFQGTSCNGSTCIASGSYLDSSNVRRPLLAQSQDSGVTWTYPSSINAVVLVPDNLSHPFVDFGFLNGISCNGSTCIAAGSYYDSGNLPRPLIALSQDSGVTWTYPSSITVPVFVPDNISHPFSFGVFSDVSCNGSTCIAVGNYSDTSNVQRPLLAQSQDSGVTWTYPSSIPAVVFVPDNTSYPFSHTGLFNSASCNGSTCIAVGEYHDTSNKRLPLLAQSQDFGMTWFYPSSINAPVFVPDNTSYPFGGVGYLNGTSNSSLWLPKSLHFLIKKK